MGIFGADVDSEGGRFENASVFPAGARNIADQPSGLEHRLQRCLELQLRKRERGSPGTGPRVCEAAGGKPGDRPWFLLERPWFLLELPFFEKRWGKLSKARRQDTSRTPKTGNFGSPGNFGGQTTAHPALSTGDRPRLCRILGTDHGFCEAAAEQRLFGAFFAVVAAANGSAARCLARKRGENGSRT